MSGQEKFNLRKSSDDPINKKPDQTVGLRKICRKFGKTLFMEKRPKYAQTEFLKKIMHDDEKCGQGQSFLHSGGI